MMHLGMRNRKTRLPARTGTARQAPARFVWVSKLLIVTGAALCTAWLACVSAEGLRDAVSDARLAALRVQTVTARSAAPATVRAYSPTATATPSPTPQWTSLSVASTVPATTPKADMLPELAVPFEQNHDLAGWLRIEGTVIDYPVMFTPADGDYYLHRNFDGRPDQNGCLIVQWNCDPFTPGTNVIIHGHNMKSGRMFGDLDKYRKKSYWQAHPVIRYDTLYERGEYEILAVFLSKVYKEDDDVFKYYKFVQADTQAEFNDFIGNVRRLALYDTGVDAQFGDKFITLSTCAYHTKNGRLAIVARKMR